MSEFAFVRKVRVREEIRASDCPNGPDEYGTYPCDPKGYFGVMECQVCGRIGKIVDADQAADEYGPCIGDDEIPPGQDDPLAPYLTPGPESA